MNTSNALLSIVAVSSIIAACASNGAHRPGAPGVAIRRGSTWATYSFKPPRIVSPSGELQLEDGVLRGFMSSRVVDVRIGDEGATGFGGGGPVNLTIAERDGRIEVDGLWNGGPVHLVFAPALVRGSVIVGRGRTGAQEVSCAYQLDRLEPSGALVGFSTCAGMPQETRLEVDAGVRAVLTPRELAVFLVAVFAAPPFAPHEWR